MGAVRHRRSKLSRDGDVGERVGDVVVLQRLVWRWWLGTAVGALPLEAAAVSQTSRYLPVLRLGESGTAQSVYPRVAHVALERLVMGVDFLTTHLATSWPGGELHSYVDFATELNGIRSLTADLYRRT